MYHPHSGGFEVAPPRGAKNNAVNSAIPTDPQSEFILIVIYKSFIQNIRITCPILHPLFSIFAISTKIVFVDLILRRCFTGTSNSALYAGTAEPIGIAPAKPVAYNMELSTTFLTDILDKYLASTPTTLYCRVQQDEKRLAARRRSAALAVANASECNTADERFSSCPAGVTQLRHCKAQLGGSEPVNTKLLEY